MSIRKPRKPRNASKPGADVETSCWGGKGYTPAPFWRKGVTTPVRSGSNARTASKPGADIEISTTCQRMQTFISTTKVSGPPPGGGGCIASF